MNHSRPATPGTTTAKERAVALLLGVSMEDLPAVLARLLRQFGGYRGLCAYLEGRGEPTSRGWLWRQIRRAPEQEPAA